MTVDEFEFINHIKQHTYKQPSIIKGVGDDAAIFRTHGNDVVTAVDTFVNNIHFTRKTASPFHIGYRTLSANISDMAAMGAEPKFYLVSIVIPPSMKDTDVLELYEGMKELASSYKMDLIGGDTVSGSELVVSITVIGYVESNKGRYRSHAKEEDVVFVTGTLGDSAVGLHILSNDLDIKHSEYFIKRHQMPEARVDFARRLQHIKRVCLNDITDGIANELAEIATASNVSIAIDDEKIPVHQGLKQFSNELQHEWKFYGGEDFELVGTVSSVDWDELQQIAKKLDISITIIGKVMMKRTTNPEVLLQKDGMTRILPKEGYTHLKQVKK